MNDKDLEGLLLSSGLIRQEEMNKAIEESQKLRRSLEKVIVDMHLLSQSVLYETVARHQGFTYKSLEGIAVDEALVKMIPEGLARQTQSVPIKMERNTLHVAMVDPSDLFAIDQIQMHTGQPIEVFLSSPQEIEDAQHRIYVEKKLSTPSAPLEGGMEQVSAPQPLSFGKEGGVQEGTSIIRLVDLVIAQAVHDRASDIHIEPEQEITRIRFRIDGMLHEIPAPPKEWEAAIISRVKVLAGMDIAESRVPQDGHFQAKIDEKIVDFRISTIPTIYGENLVMRLLDSASVRIGLERLGFATYEELKRYEAVITKPYGIILSTGPTGSGKTTTLYSALTKINTIDKHIVTIEDPVEYRLGLIRQIQVNSKAGITFANGLRAILRQDPDVIMVGEIRDLETAVIAIQAALTGHLVFSTLHTNDAPATVTRLVNMGVEPFLISASLIGVMAQRLVRQICEHCKEPYEPSRALLKKWKLEGRENVVLYRGRGCDHCKGTGYRGRIGIFELMLVDDELREMIIQGASTVMLKRKAQEKGMRLLGEDGLFKALTGVTTIEEVSRVCEEGIDVPIDSSALQGASSQPNEPRNAPTQSTQIKEYEKKLKADPGTKE